MEKNYQKRISCIDVFIILRHSANYFRVRTKEGKQKHYNKLNQIRYFNFITIAECCAKLPVLCVLLTVPSLAKAEIRNFPLLHFPKWFCLIHGELGMSL